MSIKIGDKVKFLNDVGGGRITKISGKLATVLNQDGFEVPTLISELLRIDEKELISGNVTDITREKNAKSKEEAQEVIEVNVTLEAKADTDEPQGIYFAFVPKDKFNPTESDLVTYLINDTTYTIFYHICKPDGTNVEKFAANVLEPNTKIALKTLSKKMLQEKQEYLFQLMFFGKKSYKLKQMVSRELKINPIRFFKQKSYKENDFFDELSILMPVYEEDRLGKEVENLSINDIEKVVALKEIHSPTINKPIQYKRNENPATISEVVDLHIHELIEDERGMSNQEILDIQMDYFRRKLNDAIKRRIKSITFIHGVGNGRLKLELRKELDYQYKNYKYQDASFAEFGYGATMVLTRGN